jgi:predicted RNase H-like nuclease (RuvC/YqgF family)
MSYYEKRIADLEARVAEMARQQRMKAIPVEAKLLERYAIMQADNTRLKAEVTDLKSTADQLKAEVERLRKAGDAMALNVYVPIQYEIYLKLISDWNAAKEGKV